MKRAPVRGAVRGAAAGLALLALAGCSTASAPPVVCPKVGLLGDPPRLAAFAPGGHSIRDVVVEGAVPGVKGTCRYDSSRRRVRMAVTVQITGREGPAYQGGGVDLPFFVAVVTRDERILAKRVFQGHLTFGNQMLAVKTEDMATEIPIAPGAAPADYRVMVGFQLTPAQLDYNQHHAAPR